MKRKAAMLLLLVVLLVPWDAMQATDGGTAVYSAALYTVTKRHSMHSEGEISGYLTGTEVKILSFEVYNDVRFVPAEAEGEGGELA